MSAQETLPLRDHTDGAVLVGPYRYRLWRTFDGARPRVCFVMLNPSTADATEDDQTIRKCIGFARRWGYGGIDVVNLFAWRATDPRDLFAAHVAGENIVGPENDATIQAMLVNTTRPIVVAWGARVHADTRWKRRVEDVLNLMHRHHVMAVHVLPSGAPQHPVMAAYTSAPVSYRGPVP